MDGRNIQREDGRSLSSGLFARTRWRFCPAMTAEGDGP